ncbi:ABC transporter ATP-binding protein [Kaistia dalseonensis]|uniref:Simple sugar transport system ATP-binding protein n=1 Tax=Kaistia dalseonensis TaxID=410840 RepID=A0ABU0H7I1_9HYPH|nr:ABC transporter ATP-binding protein [Kaistia dalseonensis]MCX5495665.1 ABC transporter ATP-binding protein [Kaistia dalseonensis]MDQ0438259.1 simple sugar transport system ATP-binding protein [Kaistia dalseonensis]
MSEPVLRLEGITKRFGTLTANDDVTLELRQGELLALLGENGAGKTTLMNILFGHYTPDAGRVVAFGHELPPGKPRAAIEARIGMVHQHFALAANLTVIENVIAGTERLFSFGLDKSSARAKLKELSARFGLAVDPDARVGDLSVGERQRVEILKSLYRDARILILDEPTAVLTHQEAEKLYATLRGMAEKGLSLIFISHKLHEVLAAADRVVVLRGGKVVAERRAAETSKDELAELMVGRRVARPQRDVQAPGAVLMRATSVDVMSSGTKLLSEVSFEVRAGETLGIIGVSGNGQSALGQLVSGLAKPTEGRLEMLGKEIQAPSPRSFVAAGVGRIPEDRNADGVVGDMLIWENAVLERVRGSEFSAAGFVRRTPSRAFAQTVIERFDVRGGTPDSPIRLLSGGNMQKLILGRNLATSPRILIAAQPTRGLDEGAVAAVHAEILAARRAGTAILLISEDLDEILQLADRVQAIVRGRLSPAIPIGAADPRRLGLMMAGVWDEAA